MTAKRDEILGLLGQRRKRSLFLEAVLVVRHCLLAQHDEVQLALERARRLSNVAEAVAVGGAGEVMGERVQLRGILGIESQGMLCSAVELGLGADAGGIMLLEGARVYGSREAAYAPTNTCRGGAGESPAAAASASSRSTASRPRGPQSSVQRFTYRSTKVPARSASMPRANRIA